MRIHMVKGSYTVEAAIMVSLYLFMAAAAMKAGIVLYQETAEMSLTPSRKLQPVKEFYIAESMKKLGRDVKGVYDEWTGK